MATATSDATMLLRCPSRHRRHRHRCLRMAATFARSPASWQASPPLVTTVPTAQETISATATRLTSMHSTLKTTALVHQRSTRARDGFHTQARPLPMPCSLLFTARSACVLGRWTAYTCEDTARYWLAQATTQAMCAAVRAFWADGGASSGCCNRDGIGGGGHDCSALADGDLGFDGQLTAFDPSADDETCAFAVHWLVDGYNSGAAVGGYAPMSVESACNTWPLTDVAASAGFPFLWTPPSRVLGDVCALTCCMAALGQGDAAEGSTCTTHVAFDRAKAVSECDIPSCNVHEHFECSGDVDRPDSWHCFAGNTDAGCTGVADGSLVSSDGHSWCWGGNRDFRCDDGAHMPIPSPSPIPSEACVPSACREHSPLQVDYDCCGQDSETWCATGYTLYKKVFSHGMHPAGFSPGCPSSPPYNGNTCCVLWTPPLTSPPAPSSAPFGYTIRLQGPIGAS